MQEQFLDPRPFYERPEHWHYGKCGWRTRYLWEERVAMSELGLGPEEAPLNDQGRVHSVSLRYRTISDDRLSHLVAFPDLTTVDLTDSTVTDDCIPNLQALAKLQWLWIAGTSISAAGVKQLEKANPALFVMKTGEGAIQNPSGRWIKITKKWWPGQKPWWRLW